jgi:hypothetical protein
LFAAAFFGLFAFFVITLLRAFFCGFSALLVDVFAAAGVEAVDDEAAAVPVDDLAAPFDELLFDFDVPADFFFGDAAFFFGLLALPLPAPVGLAGAFDVGLAVRAVVAFLALVVAFFLAALAAGAAAVDEALVLVVVGVLVLILTLAAFFVDAFFVGEAERFRLFAPPVDLPLLDDRAFFVLLPPDFLLPPGVFDRLRDLVEVDFVVVVFFLPADEPLFFNAVPNLKLPLAPIPFVCFNELFFVPARNADLRC